jgi:hypothetical protein
MGFKSWDRQEVFFSSVCPDWLWGLTSLLFNGYWGLFLLGIKGLRCEATTHLDLVLRLRMNTASVFL